MTQPYRIRSAETWACAREDYLAGLTAEAVCRRHDIGLSAFRRRARHDGWRRIDQDDPAPQRDALGLDIYADCDFEDQIELAWLRFNQALHHGRAIEAARWRKLHRELIGDRAAADAALCDGFEPDEVQAFRRDIETERAAAAGLLPEMDAQVERTDPPLPDPAGEIVHDVHPVFSGACKVADPEPAPPAVAPGGSHFDEGCAGDRDATE